MVRQISPREAEKLIGERHFDIIDVREQSEWASGHIPGARCVPLEIFRGNPSTHIQDSPVLLVCAKGMRSATAAKAAEDAGFADVTSLEGGTHAWAALGLPVERPADPGAKVVDASTPEAEGFDPALDEVVARNVKILRQQRGLSLDALASQTGLSRALLGQLENGRASPSVSVVWKISRAFDVPFSALLAQDRRTSTTLMPSSKAKRLVSPDGRYSSRALFQPGELHNVEFYELFIAAHSREDAEAHRPGTRENLIVTTGCLDLVVGKERYELRKGDAIAFAADVPHSYVNPGAQDCWIYLVMSYA